MHGESSLGISLHIKHHRQHVNTNHQQTPPAWRCIVEDGVNFVYLLPTAVQEVVEVEQGCLLIICDRAAYVCVIIVTHFVKPMANVSSNAT